MKVPCLFTEWGRGQTWFFSLVLTSLHMRPHMSISPEINMKKDWLLLSSLKCRLKLLMGQHQYRSAMFILSWARASVALGT